MLILMIHYKKEYKKHKINGDLSSNPYTFLFVSHRLRPSQTARFVCANLLFRRLGIPLARLVHVIISQDSGRNDRY